MVSQWMTTELDELRLADVPQGTEVKPGQRIDPLIHYAGRVNVSFTDSPLPESRSSRREEAHSVPGERSESLLTSAATGEGSVRVTDLAPFVNHVKKTVTSSTGELILDYDKGILTLNSPRAQGASGALKLAGDITLNDLVVRSDLELGHIIAVALDDQPLSRSGRILLQVMSEEQETNHKTEPVSPSVKRIVSIGTDPWQVRELNGSVRFKRADAGQLKVTALDFNGYPPGSAGTANQIKLQPRTIYYLIAR